MSQGVLVRTMRPAPGMPHAPTCPPLASHLASALDALDAALCIHDDVGQLLFANEALRRIAAKEDGLGFDRCHGLVPSDPMARRMLARALNGACAGASIDVAVTRPSGALPYALACRPLAGTPRGAMVILSDPGRRSMPSPTLLRQAFNLTPAESELALALAGGRSVNAYAEARGVSANTVRAQMRGLLGKTGQRRQAELVALIHRLGTGGIGADNEEPSAIPSHAAPARRCAALMAAAPA